MNKIVLFLMLGLATTSYGQFDPYGPNCATYQKAGIGLTIPTARFDVKMQGDFIGNDESGIRITYPNIEVPIGAPDINKSIFEVRRQVSSYFHSDFIVKRNGRIGVGTDNPQDILDIRLPHKREIIVQSTVPNTYGGLRFNHSDGTPNWRIRSYSNFIGGYDNILGIQSAGGVGRLWIAAKLTMIGDYFDMDDCEDCHHYKLFVKKGIRTEKVKVDVASGTWSDYVFADDYELKSLEEVEGFINQNGHLPNVPSAEEVEKDGLNLGDMDALLLAKIEELTLHMILLKKESDEMKTILETLKKK